ncbi:PREDICTED: uncharacterized protein LOC105556511, partial [Vollenhovia emeryi]|uniref:uncharacterized protein LOC105556511 n=1 Tax=Vollenhovia emeryi TaxID=411798 RepID=UPI0005F4E322
MSKRGKENTLFNYMIKKPKSTDENQSSPVPVSVPVSVPVPVPALDNNTENAGTSSGSKEDIPRTNAQNILDLGCYTELKNKIDDNLKCRLLDSPWQPDKSFKFPVSDGKKKLKFQVTWFDRFPWLVYTTKGQQGALCKFCVLFARDCAGKGSHQQLKSLVTQPLNKWKDALSDFKRHGESQYHKECMILADNFLRVFKKLQPDIISQIDTGRLTLIAENRTKLIPIIETIKLCGRQELALRGTCDLGPIKINDPEPEINDGNFRAILRMRNNCGDLNLRKHSESMMLNATYLSPDIQNELIATCGEIIQNKLVDKINSAKYFSILVDETTDISRQEQMSICVRYTEPKDDIFILHEDFLSFVSVERTTGTFLANAILLELKRLGINCEYLIGQGYDGAAAMKGCFNGVQTVIREIHPEA